MCCDATTASTHLLYQTAYRFPHHAFSCSKFKIRAACAIFLCLPSCPSMQHFAQIASSVNATLGILVWPGRRRGRHSFIRAQHSKKTEDAKLMAHISAPPYLDQPPHPSSAAAKLSASSQNDLLSRVNFVARPLTTGGEASTSRRGVPPS